MIQRFADWLVYGVFGMSAETHAGNAVDFFVYDSVKILPAVFDQYRDGNCQCTRWLN